MSRLLATAALLIAMATPAMAEGMTLACHITETSGHTSYWRWQDSTSSFGNAIAEIEFSRDNAPVQAIPEGKRWLWGIEAKEQQGQALEILTFQHDPSYTIVFGGQVQVADNGLKNLKAMMFHNKQAIGQGICAFWTGDQE